MNEFEKEVKLDFLSEALQLISSAEQAFLSLEGDKNNSHLLNEIFRLAHNLKGTSRAVGFGDVAEFTHEMENLILKMKEGSIIITDEVVSLLLECNDHIGRMINSLNNDLNAKSSSVDIIAKIQMALTKNSDNSPSVLADKKAKKEAKIEAKIEVEEPVVLAEKDARLLKKFESDLDALPVEVSSNDQNQNEVVKLVIPKKIEAAKASSQMKASTEDDSIRVSIARIEMLNNVVGELVIIQTVLNQQRSTIDNPLMLKSLTHLTKLSKEIQNISMSLRMIPLRQTLQKMQRIVRDTSKALDKKVLLELIGEETEIDKMVLEHLADPLVHIVRNAVDHGLESTEKRIKAGKSEQGKVSIKAFHEGNNLVIEISDDGGGINPKVIREIAIKKNVISENSVLSDDQIINLIFHPGFSTKEEVSEISGRGVGMDVVKTNIEKLSGEVKVTTEMGKGSIFRVVLPLTMAIIEGMVTKIGEERYIIPLGQIHETLLPNKEVIHTASGIGDCLKLRGEIIPLFKMSLALARQVKEKAIHEQIAIIVNHQNKKFAVLVDDILHQQQVVIKKLGNEIRNQQGFMGSSILGDGRPAFIIDLIELFSSKMKHKKSTFAEDIAV